MSSISNSSVMTASSVSRPAAAQLVGPSEPTPSCVLPLSSIDKLPSSRFCADSLHVFVHGQEPAKVIRGAISRALVFYYPLAGRLIHCDNDDDDDLMISCTGDGVAFVEAQASCRLEDVNFLDDQLPLIMVSMVDDLLPQHTPLPQKHDDPLLMIQVTEFKCGGFAVGIRYNHSITDGVGLAQFLKSVGEIARSLAQPTNKPIWRRDAIPTPPKAGKPQGSCQSPPFLLPPNLDLEYSMVDVPQDHIDLLINQVTKSTGTRCSTFDVLAAKLWQSRTRAINLGPQVPVLFSFTANIRPLLNTVIPPEEGAYYGNCIYIAHVTARSEVVACAPISEVVRLIQDTKEKMPVEFWKWAKGELAQSPFESRNTYEMMHVTDWRNVGFSEVDYGWGVEMHSGPPVIWSHSVSVVMGFVTCPPAPARGARLTARFVRKEHLAAFHDEMKNFA